MFACIAIGWVLPTQADTAKARSLVEVQSQIQQVGDDVKSLGVEKSRLLEQLQKLERQYGELANSLRAIKAEIKQQEQALQEVRNKSVATQKDMRSQEKELEGLIKSVYAMGGDKEGLKVILNQHNPAVSSRMLVYYDYISKARLQKLQTMAEDFKVLRQLEAQKDTETQLLQVSLEKKQQETEAMQALKKQREALLASIEQDYASKSVQLASLLHDEKKLQALVASLQKTDDNEAHEPEVEPERVLEKHEKPAEQPEPPKKPEVNLVREPAGLSFAELQGKLPWPVQGAITDRFGSRRYETTWDGVVISAREGADIHAVTAGRVVYADWLRGYGLMIIVDHGKGYMSLYAFNQSLHKNVGEHVRAGETLASVGRSGGRADAALYFGIRKKGRPIDPEQWCRKPAKG
ncbi:MULTISPECIES: murein hydrolase activator EnvC family protein [Methylomonas]|uniref:murein hydrolase activator EnvC family protein n=1 Tax=Methylomonas TaxID=416 RepID=UPI001E53ACC8|nr:MULTISPECIES: peptidoglycan DD-metalloendopeptidase family protein [Methylomonas]